MNTFEISPEQKEEFETKGFLHLKNAIPANLLSQLQNSLEEFNRSALEAYGKSNVPPNTSFIEDADKPLVARVNDLIHFYPDAVLNLMACPAMMAIARDLCGPHAVPLQCDALFKHKHPTSTVLWHQDTLYPRKFPYINIGVYLDDSEIDDGCLSYVVNSQHEALDICKLVQKHGWNIPNAVNAPAKAGDLLIHDMMALHGSKTKKNENVRRTIYVEMRPSLAIVDQGSQSNEWMELRRRWMGIVARRSTVLWPEESHGELPKDLKSDQEEISQILNLREPTTPAHYCTENIQLSGYPNE